MDNSALAEKIALEVVAMILREHLRSGTLNTFSSLRAWKKEAVCKITKVVMANLKEHRLLST